MILSKKTFIHISDNWFSYRKSPIFMPFVSFFNKSKKKANDKSKVYSAEGIKELKKATTDLKSVGGSFTNWQTFQIISESINNMQNFYNRLVNAVYDTFVVPLLNANQEISGILGNYFGDMKTLKLVFNTIMLAYKQIVGNVMENIEKLNGSMQFYQMKIMDMFKRSMSINVLNMFYGETIALTIQSIITGPLLEMAIFYPIFGILTIFFIIMCIACLYILIFNYICEGPSWEGCKVFTVPAILMTCIPCAICFGKDTPIQMINTVMTIENIYKNMYVGYKIQGGGEIHSVLKFDIRKTSRVLYNYNGIIVSGDHMVYENKNPIRIKDSKKSKIVQTDEEYIYCLITDNRKIFINNQCFADFMESDDIDTTLQTYNLVTKKINESDVIIETNDDINHLYQWGLSVDTQIHMKKGNKKIQDIQIGDMTSKGIVTGLVTHYSKPINMYSYKNTILSGSQMIFENGIWLRVHQSKYSEPVQYTHKYVYSITTETNRIELENGILVTDYFELDENDDVFDKIHDLNLDSMKE